VLKSVLSDGTGVEVEELQQEEAILHFEVQELFCKWNCLEAIADLEV